ncbi:MAG: hypothetical protein AAF646_06730 [Pseudomonadota bacterium]
MQQAFEFFFAAWPLVVVGVLAFVMIRAARGPKRHDVRTGGDYADTPGPSGRRGHGREGRDAAGASSAGGGEAGGD